MEKTNEILTIAGERVEVRYSGDVKDCCCRCPFSSDDACTVLDEQYVIPCRKYDKYGKYAYFVRAEEIEGTPQEVTLIPSNEDEDEAAEMAARRAYPYEGGTKGDICEASIPIFCKGFKAGIAWERERLMKELGKELFTSNQKETNLYKMGAADEREWLMKEAVECEIGWSDGYRIAPADENSMNEALAKIGVLDQVGAGVDAKVSVIIIKKEK